MGKRRTDGGRPSMVYLIFVLRLASTSFAAVVIGAITTSLFMHIYINTEIYNIYWAEDDHGADTYRHRLYPSYVRRVVYKQEDPFGIGVKQGCVRVPFAFGPEWRAVQAPPKRMSKMIMYLFIL